MSTLSRTMIVNTQIYFRGQLAKSSVINITFYMFSTAAAR